MHNPYAIWAVALVFSAGAISTKLSTAEEATAQPALVVRQAAEERAKLDTQILLEANILSSDKQRARIEKLLSEQRARLLTPQQLADLLAACQADRTTSILAAPKITVLQNQSASIQIDFGDERLLLESKAIVQSDRQTVELQQTAGLEDASGDRAVVQVTRKVSAGDSLLMKTGATTKDGSPIFAVIKPLIISTEPVLEQ